MRLTRLLTSSFRNLAPCDLSTDAPFIVFHGANAQGKTNALEAVHLLATLKPLRSRYRRELIQWETEQATVSGWVDAGGVTRHHRVDLSAATRTLSLDGKRVSDLGDWFAWIRCICFTPQDYRIVAEEPSFRRKWIDRAAFTASPVHLDVVRTYRRVLAQKGAVLRSPTPDLDLIDALNDQLAEAGAALVHRRAALLELLQPHVRQVHRTLADGSGVVSLRYRTQTLGDTVQARAEALRGRLEAVRADELRRQMTRVGPQTDDLVVELDGRAARTYASRGQVRSLVLSLKLAEMMAARDRGDVPLFLLDDVSSELDRGRTSRLVRSLAELGAQVWATTTDPSHIEGLPRAETLRIGVEAGSMVVS